MPGNITSADSVIMLSIPGVYPAPQKIEGFSADNVFSTEAMAIAETSMGVDGRFSGGFVFVPLPMTITLQADSPSNDVFDNWYNAQQTIKGLYRASAVIIIPAIAKKFSMLDGVMTSYPIMANAQRTLQPRAFVVTWGKASPSPA